MGRDARHGGQGCASAQPAARWLADVIHDPFFVEEQRQTDGTLRIHYQAPLVVGDDVYIEVKSGTFTPCFDPVQGQYVPCGPEEYRSQIWNQVHYRWIGGELVPRWRFESDWKPVPYLGTEQMFHAAIYRDVLYVPGFGGTLHKVDRHTGRALARLDPFGEPLDPWTFVAGPPSIDAAGNVYYNVIRLDPEDPTRRDAEGWLVKVTPSDEIRKVTYRSLVPEAPPADALCYTIFPPSVPRPLPPPPNPDGSPALPPQAPCLSQRPGLNVAPAIAPDGTLYTVSRAHRNDRYSYLVAVKPDLTPKWSLSLRALLDDGCGREVVCREGALPGVDPSTNQLPAGRVVDGSTSSPVVLPDGAVLFAAYTLYNGGRGHLFKVSANGQLLKTYGFGWDVTPAIYPHGFTYSILIKDNHYLDQPSRFFVTQLSADLEQEWRFEATNEQRCARGEDGQVTCEETPGVRYEWCVNAPAVDRDGTVHVASEDGNLYAIGQGGVEKGRHFLQRAIRSGYTPVVLDGQGRIYTINAGHMIVVGR